MAEEARLFVRVALYAGAITVVYWFVSYELAGTLLLGSIAVGAAAYLMLVLGLVGFGGMLETRTGNPVSRFIGFRETEAAEDPPLEIEEDVIPPASPWPFLVAVAALLIGVGLVFGAWFWLPGAALGAASAWGWAAQLD